MKWLKTMSKDELREAYEKVTNEEDLREFENHCQNIGVKIHNCVKKKRTFHVSSIAPAERHLDLFTRWALEDDDVREAVKALVNHSLKMLDK